MFHTLYLINILRLVLNMPHYHIMWAKVSFIRCLSNEQMVVNWFWVDSIIPHIWLSHFMTKCHRSRACLCMCYTFFAQRNIFVVCTIYRQTSNISRTLVGNKLVICSAPDHSLNQVSTYCIGTVSNAFHDSQIQTSWLPKYILKFRL